MYANVLNLIRIHSSLLIIKPTQQYINFVGTNIIFMEDNLEQCVSQPVKTETHHTLNNVGFGQLCVCVCVCVHKVD